MPVDIFIPDIHGDPESFRETLVQSGLAHRTSEHRMAFTDPGLRQLVFTGDYIDRGTANLETLDLLMAVRDRFKNTFVLLGNHELAALQALTHPENPRWMREWMEGVPVLREVALREHLRLATPIRDGHPLANHTLPNDEETRRYFDAWARYIDAHAEMRNVDVPAAFERTRELFLEGHYRTLFARMNVAHRIGGILAVHAGMTEKGVALMREQGSTEIHSGGGSRLERLYQLALEQSDFTALYDFNWKDRVPSPKAPLSALFCMTKRLPPDETPLITERTAGMLRDSGISVLIHGHAALGPAVPRPGVQQCNDAFRIADMNGDIVMSRAHGAHTGSTWGFVRHDPDSGQFTAVNPKTGPLDFGRLINNVYAFPRD